MQSIKHKLIAALLAMALLAGSLSVLAPSYPARALVPTAETISIPMVLYQGVLKAVEGGLYVVLRKFVQKYTKDLTKSTANFLFKGGKGKGPAYEIRPWEEYWEGIGDEAAGAALEGFVQGSVNEYEAQKKKEEVYKSLEETQERTKQLSLEGGDLNYKLNACNKELDGMIAIDPMHTQIPGKQEDCAAIAEQLNKKGEEQEKFYKDNAGKLKAQGVREDYSNKLTQLRGELDTKRTEEKAACDEASGGNPRDENCRTKRQAVIDKAREIDALNKSADAAFAQASPETSEAFKAIDKEQIDKDAALVTSQTGALSEAGRTILDIVCKPEADFALKIFLGLGDQISQTKRKPICPIDVLKKNWSRVITDAGFEPGGLLSEQTVTAWQSLASLVNPETSDLGVAWKISVSGHDVKDIARQLGVTNYDALSALGGYKGVTNLAGTVITSPAGAVGKAVDSTIESNFEGATRFVPTGHIVADLIITAGAAFLETTLDLVKDGLRKRQVVRRQPKTPSGIAALSRFGKSIYFPDGDPNAGTEAFAEATLAVFDELKYTSEKTWDVLNKITATGEGALCYNPGIDGVASLEQKAADPESCTIDEDFSRAIREGMTVQQAIDNKLLDRNGVFGFDVFSGKSDIQPPVSSSTKHYPYNSLVILRKYRIIPVSWELAALYINESYKSDRVRLCGDDDNCRLGDLVDQFDKPDKPFYKMVDPNWVLKVPQTSCKLKGYGPQVIREIETVKDASTTGSVEKETQNVRGETCVDYQTCLGEDANGNCERGFGYCLKEETIAHFTGETCEEIYDGCRSFTDSVTKQPLTVIATADSLTDYKSGTCTEKNAGCTWYSSTRNFEWNDPASNPPDTRYKLDANNRSKIYTSVTRAGLARREWSSETTNRVFFASSAQKCEPKVEGCRQIDGPAGTPPYLRLPPASLRCGTNGVKDDGSEVQWYKREECKKYTQLCKSEYVGCERYLPENDDIAVTGKSPDDSAVAVAPNTKPYQYRCPAACANIYNYAEQKTQFELPGEQPTTVARTLWFSADTAQKCSVNDVGCEEFTNLDEVARGGEGKDYFTYLQRCVKEDNPESISANEVFYHFVGSDSAGGQPEKHYVVGDSTNGGPGTDGYKPKRIDETKTCDSTTVERSKYDPRIGTSQCREFINSKGKVFYEWTDNLIYRTPDCTSYRRTIDNQAGIAHTYSPSLSRRCSAAAVDCREYRAPQAGNVRVLPKPDNFEDSSTGGWNFISGNSYENAYAISSSNEGEIVGDHSLAIKKKAGFAGSAPGNGVTIQKNITIRKDANYLITLTVKAEAGVYVEPNISFINASNAATDALTGTDRQSVKLSADQGNKWQRFSFVIQKEKLDSYARDAKLTIMLLKDSQAFVEFYLDDVIVKEFTGTEYVIRDSWVENREGSCFVLKDGAPDFDSPAYSGCSLYTDRQGAQQAIRSFERICPNEMAGCVQATVKEGKIFEKAGDPDDKKKLVDGDPIYIIPDQTKACQGSENKCTAYGVPKLLTRTDGTEELKTVQNTASDESLNEWKYKEEWNVTYLKVTPEESTVAQNKFAAGDVSPYDSGICRAPTYETTNGITKIKEDSTTHKKILGDLGCRTYTPSGGGETFFRDPGKSVCEFSPSGDHWFYYACERSSQTPDLADDIVCTTDDDCPITGGIKEKCNTKQEIVDSSTNNASSREKGCRKEYARKCPVDRIGCRNITDPNCIDRGNNKFTLENNYGRTPGTNSGISCKREYYFTEDFDARTRDCGGQVNPGVGCLLFNDKKLEAWEYHLIKNCETTTTTQCTNEADCPLKTGSSTEREKCNPLAIPQNDTTVATNPRTYCPCDRNSEFDSDCGEKTEAAPFSPELCYNRYYNGAATGERALMRKYKRVPANAQYNSNALYTQAHVSGGTTDATVATTGTLDSNTLIKVRPDRQCKVWLECATYLYSGAEKICTRRVPCDQGTPGISCTHRLEDADAPSYLNRLLEDDTSATATTDALKKAPRKELLTLSGFARPDYKFINTGYPTAMTTGGYSAHFSKLRRTKLPDSADSAAGGRNIPSDLSYNRVVPQGIAPSFEDSLEFVCTNNLARVCKTATTGESDECPALPGQLKGRCISNPGFLNACRLYPRESTADLLHNPERKKGDPAKIVDACQPSDTGSGGIYGYCLEPNPLFRTSYSSATPYPHLDTTPAKSKKGVCRSSYGSTCNKDSDCPGGPTGTGSCVYRYYENYCLNWLPVDRTGLETLFTKNDVTMYDAYNPQNRLSYCVKTGTKIPAGKPGDFPKKIGDHKVTKDFYYAADDTFGARNSSGVHKVDDCGNTSLFGLPLGDFISIKFETNPDWPSKFSYDDQCWKDNSKGQDGKRSPSEWQEVKPDMLIFPMAAQGGAPTEEVVSRGINNNEKYPDGPLKDEGYRAEHIDKIKYTFEASGSLYKFHVNSLIPGVPIHLFGADEVENRILGKEETSFDAAKGFVATFFDFDGYTKPTSAPFAGLPSAFDGCNSSLYRGPTKKIRGYFSIRAHFGGANGALDGWEVKQCGYQETNAVIFNKHYADIIFMSVDITTTSKNNISDKPIHTDDVNVSFKDDFCSEFVTVVKNGRAVADVSDPAKPAELTKAIPISCDPSNTEGYPKSNPPTPKYLDSKCTGGTNGQERTNALTDYLAFDNRKQICSTVNTTDHSTVAWLSSSYDHCTPSSEDFSQWDHTDSPANTIKETFEPNSCVTEPITRTTLQCLLEDDILPPIVPNLTDIINNDALSETARVNDVRNHIPFRKIYEYWQWDGSKYAKIHDIDDATAGPLTAFLNNTKTEGKLNRPQIYNDAGLVVNRFDADSTDANEFELSFFVDVKDSQLPIRNYTVTFPHNNQIANETTQFGDGHGLTDNFNGYGTSHTPKAVSAVRKFGPFHESYNPSSQPLKGQSGLKACVEVTDNWGACTSVCGTLDINGHMDPGGWTEKDCSR